jgi:hypothetical protein
MRCKHTSAALIPAADPKPEARSVPELAYPSSMLRWDVTIEIQGQPPETYRSARVTIGHDTVKLHHDQRPSDAEIEAFVEGRAIFFDATEEMWVDSCRVGDGSVVLMGIEMTGGPADIEGALQMKWTLRPV